MATMLGTYLDSATHKLCVFDEKQESHPKLTEKSPPESLPPVWDTFYQVDFSYSLNGFVIFWCPISSQQHSAACQADLKWSCTWKCNLLGYLSSQRPFFTLYLVFQGQNGCFRSNYRWKVNVFWPKLPHIKPLSCLSSSLQYFYQYLMDSFVLKSISRNHHLRICFMWSLWKFPVKLDRTRLTSVITNCLTAPPDSSASHASLLKQIPLGCEHIEEKRRSLQQRIRLVRCWRAFYLFADVFPQGSVHSGAVKRISWKENNYNPRGLAGRRIIIIQKKNIR